MIRRSKRSRRHTGASSIQQLPWRQIENPYPPQEILLAGQLEQVHQASLTLLENQGMRILHQGARKLLAAAGADVNEVTEIVRFDRHLVMEQVALAPSQVTLHARNPARNFKLGGNYLALDRKSVV